MTHATQALLRVCPKPTPAGIFGITHVLILCRTKDSSSYNYNGIFVGQTTFGQNYPIACTIFVHQFIFIILLVFHMKDLTPS